MHLPSADLYSLLSRLPRKVYTYVFGAPAMKYRVVRSGWCQNCGAQVLLTRHGECSVCLSTSVDTGSARRSACALCGFPLDGEKSVGGIVHYLCIPTLVRRRERSSEDSLRVVLEYLALLPS